VIQISNLIADLKQKILTNFQGVWRIGLGVKEKASLHPFISTPFTSLRQMSDQKRNSSL
jgi:hypothetical protein